jgi:hypothetical protein
MHIKFWIILYVECTEFWKYQGEVRDKISEQLKGVLTEFTEGYRVPRALQYTIYKSNFANFSYYCEMWSLILTEQQLYGDNALTEIFLPKVEDVRGHTSSWWWKEYAPLKRTPTSAGLYGAISQKAVIFIQADNFGYYVYNGHLYRPPTIVIDSEM